MIKTTQDRITLAGLIEQSNIPASLIRAVVRQMGGWESFTESAPDICRGGIDGGFHGFNFDPVWLESCDGFAPKENVELEKP